MNIQEGITAFESGDFEKALKIFMPMAEQGDPVAQAYLGEMYEIGEGIKEDAAQAFKWFRKAAEQGYGKAQYNLGLLYLSGKGVKRDAEEGAKWIHKAAEQGHDMARSKLGDMPLDGLDERKNNILVGLGLQLRDAKEGHHSCMVPDG
ncbi:MAG: hypothetical protein BA874_00040 [Desulfuromonadales bacterium C00003068]|jgi:TPR repeat protein|nr:MAG: hypothetical protein BA874_00040 [Desulfuromonadales bacterium C00003068]